jgi:hypothetical protein
LAASLAALVVVGCGAEDVGKAKNEQSGEPVVVDIQIKDGTTMPAGELVDVKVNQQVTLRISSDAHEVVHVHTEPEQTYELRAGEGVEESFTAFSPGVVAVEAHHLDVTIVRLVVR